MAATWASRRAAGPAVAILAALALGGCGGVTGGEGAAEAGGVSGDRARVLTRIAFGSCSDPRSPLPVFDVVAATDPDLLVFMGDNVYADTEDPAEMRATYDLLAGLPGFRRLRAAAPVLATWDDHDYGVNDGGREYPAREASERIFEEFWDVPAEVRERPGIYHARTFGPSGRRVQVILLDTRFFRGPLVPRDESVAYESGGRYQANPDTTIPLLGEEQWAWLEARLAEPAELRLVVSSIQLVADGHGYEKWGNLPHERRRFMELVRRTGADGVVVISGDRHLAEISRLPADEGVGYPLFDVTASAFNKGGGWEPRETNRHRASEGQYTYNNFGLVEVEWGAPEGPLLSLEIRDEAGARVYRQEVPLAALRR